MPAGEKQKSLKNFSLIIDELIEQRHHRDTTLIALGGGVIGDLTGFTAACYLRGVNFIQIPTTLLAQVDASIGGKTAVNHASGKNLIGAFYQPNAVIIDTTTLKTLPKREFHAGFAEIIKAALIHDADFFHWIEVNQKLLLAKNSDAIHHSIKRACEIKAYFVSQDEKDHGMRMHLNLGHTFGHAIEQQLNYAWHHGEAVAYGIALAAKMSLEFNNLSHTAYQRIIKLLQQFGILKKLPKNKQITDLTAAMQHDKKIKQNRLQLILLSDIGQSIITDKVNNDEIISTWCAFENCN